MLANGSLFYYVGAFRFIGPLAYVGWKVDFGCPSPELAGANGSAFRSFSHEPIATVLLPDEPPSIENGSDDVFAVLAANGSEIDDYTGWDANGSVVAAGLKVCVGAANGSLLANGSAGLLSKGLEERPPKISLETFYAGGFNEAYLKGSSPNPANTSLTGYLLMSPAVEI